MQLRLAAAVRAGRNLILGLRGVAAATALAVCLACSPKPDTSAQFRIEPNPPRVGTVTIYVSMPSVKGPVTLEGDMAHPGMAPVAAEAKPAGVGGQYRGQLILNMPGDWIISAKAKLPDGRIIEQQFPTTVSEK